MAIADTKQNRVRFAEAHYGTDAAKTLTVSTIGTLKTMKKIKTKQKDDYLTFHNEAGYPDPTAYYAIQNVDRKESKMSISRGDIYYVEKYQTAGNEQQPGRPAIIVSNNKNNEHSDTFEVVYLTTQPKNDLPTHVTIHSCARTSIALCEQITTVYIDRLGTFVGRVTEQELAMIDVALMTSLGLRELKKPEKSASSEDVQDMKPKIRELEELCDELNESVKEKDECVCDMNATILDLQDRLKKYKNHIFVADTKNELLRELYESAIARLPSNGVTKEGLRDV